MQSLNSTVIVLNFLWSFLPKLPFILILLPSGFLLSPNSGLPLSLLSLILLPPDPLSLPPGLLGFPPLLFSFPLQFHFDSIFLELLLIFLLNLSEALLLARNSNIVGCLQMVEVIRVFQGFIAVIELAREGNAVQNGFFNLGELSGLAGSTFHEALIRFVWVSHSKVWLEGGVWQAGRAVHLIALIAFNWAHNETTAHLAGEALDYFIQILVCFYILNLHFCNCVF